jgi:hypothetical protein
LLQKWVIPAYKEVQPSVSQDLKISGFSDEISSNFDTQLEVVSKLGMHDISR